MWVVEKLIYAEGGRGICSAIPAPLGSQKTLLT